MRVREPPFKKFRVYTNGPDERERRGGEVRYRHEALRLCLAPAGASPTEKNIALAATSLHHVPGIVYYHVFMN